MGTNTRCMLVVTLCVVRSVLLRGMLVVCTVDSCLMMTLALTDVALALSILMCAVLFSWVVVLWVCLYTVDSVLVERMEITAPYFLLIRCRHVVRSLLVLVLLIMVLAFWMFTCLSVLLLEMLMWLS